MLCGMTSGPAEALANSRARRPAYWFPLALSGLIVAPPEQILAERFARGEIDEDEFHQRMTVLRAEAPPHPGPAGPQY
jgi:Short C-terminal domain